MRGGDASASPAGAKGSSATESVGAQVLQLRDDLTKAAYAGKVETTRADLGKRSPVLADLAAGKRYTIQPETQQLSSAAQLRADESNRLLGDPTATRGNCHRCRPPSRNCRTCPARSSP